VPHKRPRKPKPPAATRVERLKDLARIFGLTDDTMTAWRRNGAPPGPPFSVVEWYVWAKTRGYTPRLPEDAELAKLCERAQRKPVVVNAGAVAAAADLPQHLVAAGVELGIDPPNESELQEGDRVLAWQRWGAAIKLALEIGERRKELIPAEQVRERMKRLADRVLEHLTDVHAVVSEVEHLSQPQRGQLRDALTAWLARTRARMSRPTAAAPATEQVP
jgi:hypothetical protein